MTKPTTSTAAPRADRFGLNPWLQRFLTIIAGTVVAVIAWTIIARFMHIIVLLLASLLVAFLLGPLVDRLEQRGMPRILAILLLYLTVLGALALGVVLLVGPLTAQLQGLTQSLPTLLSGQNGAQLEIDRFFQQQGIPLRVSDLLNQLSASVSTAASSLLGGTLAILTGVVSLLTDLGLILAITFYLLLDGQNMRTWGLRLLPNAARERWFFVEATLNRVLGGYIRGQIIVALTVGVAAGVGSAVLGVHYPLVIGLLAFLFEFIPLLGPILGMIPAVILALFQPMPLVWWVIIYFIVLQQVESNVIVPRVSGHAVGLHPLAALLALLAGVELGGLAGALVGVPVVGVLYVAALALMSDASGQTRLLRSAQRRTTYSTLQQALGRRRGGAPPAAPAPAPAPAVEAAANERLTTIVQEQAQLSAQFAAKEAAQAEPAPDAAPAAGTPASAPPASGTPPAPAPADSR
jgi:predicted PurR-regulated permease PerM